MAILPMMIDHAAAAVNAHPRERGLFSAHVVENKLICREHYRLRFKVDGEFPTTRPGQFIQLGCRTPESDPFGDVDLDWQPGEIPTMHQPELCGPLAFLRRPFSLSGRDGSVLEVIHRVVGVGTQWLADLRVGDVVDLIGPLGNAFELPLGKSLGLLVGGGVGLPPMFYLAEAMRDAGWDAVGFVGAMNKDLLAVTWDGDEAAEFKRLGFRTVITTDDGSFGIQGLITDGLLRTLGELPDVSQAVIYTCGPEPMMRAVAMIAAELGIDCQVCLEQAMACGMGTCQSCIVRIEEHDQPHGKTDDGRPWRYRLACTDGPVFDSTQVLWC